MYPITRLNWHEANISVNSMRAGSYLVEGGVERLVLAWKANRQRRLIEQNGGDPDEITPVPALNNLLYEAGSSSYCHKEVPQIGWYENHLHRHDLAPYQSDGKNDTAEWNLFEAYLDDDLYEDGSFERHNLSNMIRRWTSDAVSTWRCSRIF